MFKLPKSIALTIALGLTLIASGGSFAQSSGAAHQGTIWGSVRTQDRSTNNIFDKRVKVIIRQYEPDKLGAIVAQSGLHQGHYIANLHDAPSGKYVVQVNPLGSDYGTGQTIVDYPGPAGNVHQNFTLVLGGPAVPSKE
jgi:hypothetical protein